MRHHVIEVNERELRAFLSALDFAFEEGPPWWRTTKYLRTLYARLRGHGLVSERARKSLHA
jgi:hypothetical protein